MKILVIYHSFEGSTKLIAETIAKVTNADILELKTKEELVKTHGFMKYFWGGRSVVFKDKPELLALEKNPTDYDLIFIGTPVWAFTFTPPLRSLLAQEILNNKKIAIFCTHEGGPGKTLENMKNEFVGNEIVSEMDFKNVKKNPDENIEKATEWAKQLFSKMA
jgi:flavodoxin